MAGSNNVFGVDVYITELPACASQAHATEVRAQVNPFEAEATLSEVVTELARRTREVGGNTLYGIRILSAAPSQGAEVAGSAATCQASADAPSALIKSVLSSSLADVFIVRPHDPVGPDRSIRNSDVTQLRSLSGDDLAKIKDVVARSQQLQTSPVVKGSCPLVPVVGFRFGGSDGEVWWLASLRHGCEASVLLKADDDWRKTGSIPLAADAVGEIARYFKP